MPRQSENLAEVVVGGTAYRVNFFDNRLAVEEEKKKKGGVATLWLYSPERRKDGRLRYKRQKLSDLNGRPIMCAGPDDLQAIAVAEASVRRLYSEEVTEFARPQHPAFVSMDDVFAHRLRLEMLTTSTRRAITAARDAFRAFLLSIGRDGLSADELDDILIEKFIVWLGVEKRLAPSTGQAYARFVLGAWNAAQDPRKRLAETDKDGYPIRFQLMSDAGRRIRLPEPKDVARLMGKPDVRRKAKRAPEAQEWAELLNHLDPNHIGQAETFRAIVFGLNTGLRSEHIAQSDLTKIDRNFRGWGYDALDVMAATPDQLHHAHKRRPDIRLTPGLSKHLAEWGRSFVYDDFEDGEEVTEENSTRCVRRARYHIAEACARAGLDHISLSMSRHTVITNLRAREAPKRRDFMGHADGIQGEHYDHRTSTWFEPVMGAISSFMEDVAKHCKHPIYF